ncbi:hypothetical protein [Maribellus maritimus]|uniref:hypothetical protein n=1 Tax=Maribellus maritimus TaxID=2870838 RepID=UPI001EEBC398|nr:hypothetical protein [Maribellus maritimus]MCG6185862.1 hypothetical protein [Maribellus maritimus]
MIKALLTIRLKQISRGIVGIGLFRMLFLIALLAFAGFALYVKSADEVVSKYISIGFLLLVFYVQVKREDKLFLKTHFSSYKMLLFSEYLVLALPVIICFLIHKQWIALSFLAGLVIVPSIDFKTRYSNLNTKLQKLIPVDAVEWKSGVRKHFFVIVPLWIIAAGTSFFIGSVPIVIFVFGILILGFFEKCEPYQVLLAYEINASKLLKLKIKRQIQLFSIPVLPLLALFVLFHPENWYFSVAEYLIFCSLLVFGITAKYAFFKSNEKSPAAQTFVAIGTVGSIIPVFLPVVWFLTVWFYIKSVDNLNFYLNDYN